MAVVEKKRKREWEGQRETKVRNLANGYVFVQNISNEPEGVRQLALDAAKVTASHFAGVDIGYNEKKDTLFFFCFFFNSRKLFSQFFIEKDPI